MGLVIDHIYKQFKNWCVHSASSMEFINIIINDIIDNVVQQHMGEENPPILPLPPIPPPAPLPTIAPLPPIPPPAPLPPIPPMVFLPPNMEDSDYLTDNDRTLSMPDLGIYDGDILWF